MTSCSATIEFDEQDWGLAASPASRSVESDWK